MASTSEEAVTDSNPTARDYSQVKPALQLGTTGLKQLLQCYHLGTEEIKETLMQECDVVIECKVCRSLYRGLPNFFAHKRHYCQSKYSGSLVRFQELASKEDECYIFGSSYFSSGDETVAKETNVSPTKSLYNHIGKVEQNISQSRSTDKIVQLDAIKQNKNAVKQHLTFPGMFNKEPVVVLEPMVHADISKKRKAEDQMDSEGKKSKVHKFQSEVSVADNNKSLNGIYPKPTSNKIINLRQFYMHHRLTKDFNNTCLKCKLKFSNYKNLSRHMQRHHLKRNMFHSCKKCSKLFLNSSSYTHHLISSHAMSLAEAKFCTNKPKVEKFVMDNGHVYNIPQLRKLKPSDEKDSNQSSAGDDNSNTIVEEKSPEKVETTLKAMSSVGGSASSFEALLTVMKCLGILFVNIASHKYKCLKHPSIRFRKFDSLKAHVEEKHFRSTITCPICPQGFKRCNGSQLDKLVKHLTAVHKVTKVDIIKFKSKLRKCVLSQVDNTGSDKVLEFFKCPQCSNIYESMKNLKYHLATKHDMSKEECVQFSNKSLRFLDTDQNTAQLPTQSIEEPESPQLETISIDDENTEAASDEEVTVTEVAPEPLKEDVPQHTPSLKEEIFNSSSRKSLRNIEDGHVASTFNLEDLICLWCPLNFPKVTQLMKHIKNHHSDKWDPEKSEEIREEINKKKEKHQAQIILNLSASRSRRSMPGMVALNKSTAEESNEQTTPEDSEDMEGDGPNEGAKSRRKQMSPSKSEGYLVRSDSGAGKGSLVTFKSGFALHRCTKCAKVFGKEKALKEHEQNCHSSVVNDQSNALENSEESENSLPADKANTSLSSNPYKCCVCCRFIKKSDVRMSNGIPVMMHKQCEAKNNKEQGSEKGDENIDEVGNGDSESVDTSPISNDAEDDLEADPAQEEEVLENNQDAASSDEEDKVFTCPVCSIEEPRLSALNVHLVKVHAWKKTKVAYNQNFIKEQCSVSKSDVSAAESMDVVLIDSEPDSEEPSASQTSKPNDGDTATSKYRCVLCPKSYRRIDSVVHHWQTTHNQDEESIKKLKEKCREMYKRDQENLAQKNVHFKCLFCQKSFSSLNNLVTHWRTLHKQSSTAISDLKEEAQAGRDKQLQDREHRFSCTLCTKTYPRIDRLVAHWQAVHQQSPSAVDRLKKTAIQARDEALAKANTDEG